MCGICGKFSPNGVKAQDIRLMLRTITHRGPDDEGVYLDPNIGLGNRRLSIIDLSHGHQPMSNEDGSIWIVYNGEIYNYKKLREQLENRGHQFRTQSDTEVILHLYEEYGEHCVERLRGMYAFAIWDSHGQMLFLARDRIGQKPLFYAQEDGEFLFASEVKAILEVSRQEREIDHEALHHYLSLRFIPSPLTMFRHIKKLPPAHTLTFKNGQIKLRRYWDLSFGNKLAMSEADFSESLREKLAAAIHSHLISDVPVGAYLSGGMDSSMVVALMAGEMGNKFKTFTIGVEEEDFNEIPYARLVARRYQTDHYEQLVQANSMTLLPKIIRHMDEPSDPIAACYIYAGELASRHVKVVLGGDGGDELFAGFDRYYGLGLIDTFNHLPFMLRDGLLGIFLDSLPDSFAYKNLTQKMRWIHQLSKVENLGERFAEAVFFFRFNHQAKKSLYSESLWNKVGDLNSSRVIADFFDKADSGDAIDRMLYADFMTLLPEHSMTLTDRMNMAYSVEARSPFVDEDLVEYTAAIPSGLKIQSRRTKYLLRKLAYDYLPEPIVQREKMGFMLPVAYWFRNGFSESFASLMLDSHFVKEGLFRRDYIISLLNDHRNNRVDNHVRLWMLMNLELWFRMYIERADHQSVEESFIESLLV